MLTCGIGVLAALLTPMKMNHPIDIPSETPEQYNARAKWFRDAKVGVFVHWNPSSIIGREISWCRDDYGHEKYDNLYKQFRAEKFQADEWVKLFHESGIRYAVLVPKHHDGFSMWDTKTSDYSVMRTPFGRDYIKEMSAACQKGGVQFCLYYSIMDWWNPKYSGKSGADLTAYKNDVFKPHLRELLTHYGHVGCIWFDGNWEASWTHSDGREMYAYARSLSPSTLLGNRIEPKPTKPEPELTDSGERGVAVNPDLPFVSSFYNAPDAVGDYQAREMMFGNYYDKKAWDSCYNFSPPASSPNGGWSWMPPAQPRPMSDLVHWIVQCVGRDGNALLGIGPRPDGTIDPATAARMLELGDWLKLNGSAIYGTRGGPYLPGSWGVSTRKGKKVNLFITKWRGDSLVMPSLNGSVKSARVITGGSVSVHANKETWTIDVPPTFRRPMVTIVELTLDRDIMSHPLLKLPEPINLALGKPVEVSSIWPGRAGLVAEHITDGKIETMWATEEKARSGWVVVDLQKAHAVSEIVLSDAPYGRIQEFDLEAEVKGTWIKIASGTTIGDRLEIPVQPIQCDKLRLNIRKASDTPTLSEFQVFGDIQ